MVVKFQTELKYDYLKKLFIGLDGIWYLICEEKLGLEKAFELDHDVWKIMGKIAARKVKELLELKSGMVDLSEAIKFRLEVEGYSGKPDVLNESTFGIKIDECPWSTEILKSGNIELMKRVGRQICPELYQIWANEFGNDIELTVPEKICEGQANCYLNFCKKNK